jgi:DNA-binding protein H-NS
MRKTREIAMTTIAKLLAQKQRLLQRLQENPGPHERDEIERLLAEIDAALNQLDEMAERDAIGVQIITDAFKGRSARRSCGCA